MWLSRIVDRGTSGLQQHSLHTIGAEVIRCGCGSKGRSFRIEWGICRLGQAQLIDSRRCPFKRASLTDAGVVSTIASLAPSWRSTVATEVTLPETVEATTTCSEDLLSCTDVRHCGAFD